MTTVPAQAARTSGLTWTAALLLAGCSASTESVYRIEGVIGGFCVPVASDVTPTQVGGDAAIHSGFALRGCWQPGGLSCVGPQSVMAISVSDTASYPGSRYDDFSSEGHIATAAASGRPKSELLTKDLMAIPDSVDRGKWFLWSVVDSGNGSLMQGGDKLEADCVESASESGYVCTRQVLADDFLLSYSFFSPGSMPINFSSLDRQLRDDIEALKCQPADSVHSQGGVSASRR